VQTANFVRRFFALTKEKTTKNVREQPSWLWPSHSSACYINLC